MTKGKKKSGVFYRSVKFPLCLTDEQLEILNGFNVDLTKLWNEAWKDCQMSYEKHIKPIYDEIVKARNEDKESGFDELWQLDNLKKSEKSLLSEGFPFKLVKRQKELLLKKKEAFQENWPSLFSQINGLTNRPNNCQIPRNFLEETLDCLHASFKSHIGLKKQGDRDARPPGMRDKGLFHKIPGRYGFSIKSGNIALAPRKFGLVLSFPIPDYQRKKLKSQKVKKIEIYRDERDLEKSGRFWISISFEILKPETIKKSPENTVFLAIGASRIGIVSPKGEFCWNLGRPDFHWMPKIHQVNKRLKKASKGSLRWKRLAGARTKMFSKLGTQQKQNQYETVQKLLRLGIHFVVTELKVRSKPGALANAKIDERGGSPFGLNWSAQNTGNIANLVAKLTEKSKEKGGSVTKVQSPTLSSEERKLPNDKRKILLARKLKN